jgi:hypothetical protein
MTEYLVSRRFPVFDQDEDFQFDLDAFDPFVPGFDDDPDNVLNFMCLMATGHRLDT